MRAGTPALLVSILLAAAASAAPADLDRARQARDAGRLGEAVALLRQVAEAEPANLEARLLLAETLVWSGELASAERAYRGALALAPGSRDARVGLARTLLWQRRTDESAAIARQVLAASPGDADALLVLATADYWRGDWRAAAAGFRAVLRLRPGDAEASRQLAEVRATTRPSWQVDVGVIDDDQPMRTISATTTIEWSSDPMTRWHTRAGGLRFEPETSGSLVEYEDAADIAAGARIGLAAGRAALSGELRVLRHDSETRVLGHLRLERSLSASWRLEIAARQRELLRSATAIGVGRHPWVREVSAALATPDDARLAARLEARRLDYSDENAGWQAFAWVLTPLVERGRTRLSLGLAASFADSDQTTFRPYDTVIRPGGVVGVVGVYDPYFTPLEQRELRPLAVLRVGEGRRRLELSAEGGWGRERVIVFPDRAPGSSITSLETERDYHPWRAGLTGVLPLGERVELRLAAERSSTAFYRADVIHASVGGRL